MSKHKHYEMIVAKAADTELVVFFKCDTGWYFDDTSETIKFHSDTDYFLCLPQHKEYCLHWLNGGEVQDLYNDEWTYCAPLSKTINTDSENSLKFSHHHMFMNEEFNFRIKPKKVKRWIGVHSKSGAVTQGFCDTKKEIEGHVLRGACSPKAKFCDWQFIEIEVEG